MFDCRPFENHFPFLFQASILFIFEVRKSGCLFLQGRNQGGQSVVCQRRKLLLLVLLVPLWLLFRCILTKIKVVYFTALLIYNFNTFAGKEAPANLNRQIALSLPPCQGTLDLQSAGKMVCLTFDVEHHPSPCAFVPYIFYFLIGILIVLFFPSGFCWI